MNEPTRILILTADAGFGHRSAANAVAAALAEQYGDRVTVEIANPLNDKRVPLLLRESQSDYDKLVKTAPKLYNLGYELSDAPVPAAVVDGALTLMLFEALRAIVRRTLPDVIVTTYPLYQAPLKIIGQVRRTHIPLLTVVTDLASVHSLWFHPSTDQCLVPTDTVRNLARKNGLAQNKIEIVGIPVHPNVIHAAAQRDRVRADLGLEDDKTTILAVGSKRVGHLPGVLNLINHSGLPIELLAVAGGDDKLFDTLEATTWHIPTRVYNYVNNLPELMHAADVVICKAGGLIVSESLAAGKPILLVDVLPGQELGNAEVVANGGAGVWAKEPATALETLYHWLDHNRAELAERATAARHLGKPQAAFEIARRAWEAGRVGPQPSPLTQPETTRLITWLRSHGLSSDT